MNLWSGKMTKNNKIKALEERVDSLEKEFVRLLENYKQENNSSLDFEEVMDLWLNGKKDA